MGSSFDFLQDPIIPGQERRPQMETQQPISFPAKPTVAYQEEVNLQAGKGLFTVIPDEDAGSSTGLTPLPNPDIDESTLSSPKKKRGRRKKEEPEPLMKDIVRSEHVEGSVESAPTMYSYAETTNMTRETIDQLNMLASEIKDELDSVRMSKTLRRRNDYIVGLSSNLGQLLATKLTAIREINNSISRSNELDYKKAKDLRAIDNAQNDDNYLMDLYNAFITNPGNVQGASLGPSAINAAVVGTPIVRANTSQNGSGENSGQMMDAGYLNYVSNKTPEQRMMYLESNPNIKQVVVYDASNGNKFFQVMNMATGEAVTGVPVRDQMFMEDTTIDLKNRIARNTNLNETYPLVVINDSVTSEY